MAVRSNLLELYDFEHGIELYKKDLDSVAVFEKSQTLTKDELKRMSEHRRQINKQIKTFEEEIEQVEKENGNLYRFHLRVFVFVVILRLVNLFYLYIDYENKTWDELQAMLKQQMESSLPWLFSES